MPASVCVCVWVFLKVKLQPPSEFDMLLFASSLASAFHFLVQTAEMWPTNSQQSKCEHSRSSVAFRQTSDYAYNGLYLTLIHYCVRFSDLLTGTYFTLRVFRLTYSCPLPPPHQSATPTPPFCCYFCANPNGTKRGTWLTVNYFRQFLTVCQSLDLWLSSHLRDPDIQHCHRERPQHVIELKSTKPVVDCTGKSQSLKIWNQVTTLVAISTIQVKSPLVTCVSLCHTQSNLPPPPSPLPSHTPHQSRGMVDTIPDNLPHQSGD